MFKKWFKKKKASTPPTSEPSARPPPPDVGLETNYELVEFLGRGGSGDTWLYRNRETQELVAIKLIPRPFPKAMLPAQVEREIKVRLVQDDTETVLYKYVPADQHLQTEQVPTYLFCVRSTRCITQQGPQMDHLSACSSWL